MKMLQQKRDFLTKTVRNVIATDPLVSVRRMREVIENNTGYGISVNYTAKLMREIRQQAVIESDHKQLSERLSEVRERFRTLIENLNRTIYWTQKIGKQYGTPEPSNRDRLSATKLVGQLELALFRTELEVGKFRSGRIALTIQNRPLPIELLEG